MLPIFPQPHRRIMTEDDFYALGQPACLLAGWGAAARNVIRPEHPGTTKTGTTPSGAPHVAHYSAVKSPGALRGAQNRYCGDA